MTDLALALWSFPVLLVLVFLRMPIALAMIILGVTGTTLVTGTIWVVLHQLKTLIFGTFSTYSFSVIPLFLLMGQFALISGLSTSLFKAAEAFLGHRKGGVAMSAIGACAGFGAICGSSLATAATMGQVALPELRRYGYSAGLSTGTLAAGGTLGILIPPSVILVVYAILAEQNIEKLFIAALVPGFLSVIGYMFTIALWVRLRPDATCSMSSLSSPLLWLDRLRALSKIWSVCVLFIVVVGGIYAGFFTPTEAAAIGAAGTFFMALRSGQLGLVQLRIALLSVAESTAMIFFIILAAGLYNNFLSLTQLPQGASLWVAAQDFSPWFILVVILGVYILLGCVLDSFSVILLTVPILFPLVSVLDFGMSLSDFGLWFGILVLLVVELGLITPPVGLNLFIIHSMSRVSLVDIYRGVLPFVCIDLLKLIVLTLFPALTLWLVWLLDSF